MRNVSEKDDLWWLPLFNLPFVCAMKVFVACDVHHRFDLYGALICSRIQRVKLNNTIMAYYYSRKLSIPFDEAVQKITQNLQQQGFGIITSIDLQDTLKQKLNVDFRKYKILGACNPEFAYKGITLESHFGLMLPCNIVVQEHENKEIEVSAISPLATIDEAMSTTQIVDIAKEVNNRLRAAVDDLHRDKPEPAHAEALPTK
jgi:uncharacterized protein (DUF302 family)